MDYFSTENLSALVNTQLIEGENVHYHYDPETEFFNKCHGKGGKFCSTGGSGGGGDTSLNGRIRNSDGLVGKIIQEGGPHVGKNAAGSKVNPHDGTHAVDGVNGYDAKGKPVPGTDAWLEAHGISRQAFEARPYVKFEANRNDPAIQEAFKGPELAKGKKFWEQRLEQEGQTGGYIMYKHHVPGTPEKPTEVAPQVRPNVPVVTDMSKRSYAKTVLETSQTRLETLKKITGAQLIKEQKSIIKQHELNLERVKKATPESIRAEANARLEKAQAAVTKAKASGNPEALVEAKLGLVQAKREHKSDMTRAHNYDPVREEYTANQNLLYAQQRLTRFQADPKKAVADEIKAQERTVTRNKNRYDKTAAKYIFTPGTKSARIEMSQDPQNVKNLTQGKGRIYFAMEGSIKNDAVLTALKKEDPTAAVVNVPSVTLWQDKDAGAAEIAWFSKKYAKGREVILIPDADGVHNPNVMSQAKGLQAAIQNSAGKSTKVILAAPPLKAGTKLQIDHFNLPSGVDEGRKGIDDHLGAGRGTLGQLQYSRVTKLPDYTLSHYSKSAANSDVPAANRVNRNSVANAQKALAAISGIVGEKGAAQIPKKLLAQAAGLPNTSAKDARDTLVKMGVIKVEHIWDENDLARQVRTRNPAVSDERVNELVSKGIIKQPRTDKKYVEVSIEESPVVSILKPEYIIKNVDKGTLSDLPSWKPPKSFKGWTSPITGKPDSTGIAEKLVAQQIKASAKKAAASPTLKKAPPGRKLVRSEAGAKKYGVAIGQPIPLQIEELFSMVSLTASVSENELFEFYNKAHDKRGRFAPTGGSGGGAISGKELGDKLTPNRASSGTRTVSGKAGTKGAWPPETGRPIETISKSRFGKVKVDGLKVKAAYDITTNNGEKIRMYDITGKAGKYKESMLNTTAKMHELYPLSPPRDLVVIPKETMAKLSGHAGTHAIVFSSHPVTFVNSDALGYDHGKARDGWSMPSAKTGNTKDMSYTLTHEYGHQYDFATHFKNGKYRISPLMKNPAFVKSLSTYGKHSPIEAYAEAFAEYHHSNGTTTNAAALALARAEGWHNSSSAVTASGFVSLVLENTLLSFSEYVSLTLGDFAIGDGDVPGSIDIPELDGGIAAIDNFETGADLIGDYQSEEPTDAEIAAANEIMAQVLKDLGQEA